VGNAHFDVSRKNKPLPPSSEAGAPYPKELVFFGIEINKVEVSIILSSRHPGMSKTFCRFEEEELCRSNVFCTGGYREVAKEVEDPVDLEMLMLSPVPARGRKKKIDACFGCRCPPR
jgi:hypothetical protein